MSINLDLQAFGTEDEYLNLVAQHVVAADVPLCMMVPNENEDFNRGPLHGSFDSVGVAFTYEDLFKVIVGGDATFASTRAALDAGAWKAILLEDRVWFDAGDGTLGLRIVVIRNALVQYAPYVHQLMPIFFDLVEYKRVLASDKWRAVSLVKNRNMLQRDQS